jgi:transketolase C-terminal domain/subunit
MPWQRALYSPDNTIGKQFQKKTKICLVHRSHSGQKGITHSNSHIIALITKFPNLSMLTAHDKQTTALSILREVNLAKNI